MIVGGTSSTGRGLAGYLTSEKNERAKVLDIRGSAFSDLREAVRDWRTDRLGTKAEKPIYHAWLRPSDTDRELSREDWNKAVMLFEKEMGFEGQPRAIVYHHGEGQGEQGHIHLVYSRIQDGKAISNSWDYRHHQKARLEIEKAFDLEHVYAPLLDKDEPRRAQAFEQNAKEQGKRLGTDPKEIKAEVSELYRSAENGRAFVAGLEEAGYSLAQGDQRGYVILDQAGGIHSLSRMAGVKVAELRETLREYPLQGLPTVEAARESRALEREAFAALHSVGTLEHGHDTSARGAEDAPTRGTGDDPAAEGMRTGAGALGAIAGGVADFVGGLFWGLAGGDPKPPTKEQQAATGREAQATPLEERLKRYNEEHRQRQERERGQGPDRGRERER